MLKPSMKYAVIYTYSFDSDSAVYLFDDYDDAADFLEESFERELETEIEECGADEVEFKYDNDRSYAAVIHHTPDGDDVCEYRLCTTLMEDK